MLRTPTARINKTVKDNSYQIVEFRGAKKHRKRVEAFDIAYGVLGFRKTGKIEITVDHIPSGYRVAVFPSEPRARQAARELMQVTDFTWLAPPDDIKQPVNAILKRLAR